jgi:uncharacterized protein
MKFIRVFFLFTVFPLLGMAQEFPEKPNPPRLVNDFTQTLSPQEAAMLEQKLVAYNDSTSTQIAIVMISSLGGYPIDDYSFQLAERWGIGQKGKNNGVLVFVAKDDRKIFIATGYGMEGVMPDGLVKRIVESDIKPFFKQGDYYGGLNKGTDSMFRLAAGEYQAEPGSDNEKKSPIMFIAIFIFFMIIAMAMKVRSVQKYAIVNNIAFWAAWELLNQSRRVHHGSWGGFTGGGGSWGGGGGGGGFGGFGGGSFGGGGAGGSW